MFKRILFQTKKHQILKYEREIKATSKSKYFKLNIDENEFINCLKKRLDSLGCSSIYIKKFKDKRYYEMQNEMFMTSKKELKNLEINN